MTTTTISLDELARIITASAGIGDGATIGPDTLDVTLSALGYDSLALLETVSRIERELGVALDESAASAELTVGELLDTVNSATAR